MKNIIYISILLLIITSCKKENELKNLSNYFEKQLIKKEVVAVIDFSKTNSTLIKSIEKETGLDLCNNSVFIAQTSFDNIEIKFPAFARKNCDDFTHNRFDNVISVLINKNNEILVDDEIISSKNSIKNHIFNSTKDIIENTNKKSLIYFLNWSNQLDSEKVKKRITEILFAIKNYSNELALKKYHKGLEYLNQDELLELNKEFKGIIGFNDSFNPPPPPPQNRDL